MRIKNILQYLEITAGHYPDKVAFSAGDGGEALTFFALLDGARRVGSALCRQGLGGRRVALLIERRPRSVALLLGVTYAGAVAVPLDPNQPTERMRSMCERAEISAVVCDASCTVAAQALSLPVLDAERLIGEKEDAHLLGAVREAQIDTDPLYIVFTSGSTGTPKGVLGCHRAVIDYAEALGQALSFDPSDVFGCQSPLFYDAWLKELIGALKYGATVLFVPQRLFAFPVPLLQYLERNGVNTVCWVASALANVCALGALEVEVPTTLRRVVFGSEPFAPSHLRAWRAALPDARFYQLYGPTEATGMSCVFLVDREFSDNESIPIGRPLDNTGLLLIGDDQRLIVPALGQASACGEMLLRGSCLTLGYDHDDRTSDAFVQNPLQNAYPETVYRTGDTAYYNERGELVFVGRRDGQIKRMGHRIELGEIEAKAHQCRGVEMAVCLYRAESKELGLVYFGTINEQALAKELREQLPRHMMPSRLCRVSDMPRLATGKIDRRALAAKFWEVKA